MKLRSFFLFIVFVLIVLVGGLFPVTAGADALGLTVGGPTFIHYTRELDINGSVEVGASFSYNNANHFYGDYLKKQSDVFKHAQLKNLSLLYGLGGLLVVTSKDRNHKSSYYGEKSNSLGFGVRIPLGLEWMPSEINQVGFQLQINPVVSIAPETNLEFMAGIGFKFWY